MKLSKNVMFGIFAVLGGACIVLGLTFYPFGGSSVEVTPTPTIEPTNTPEIKVTVEPTSTPIIEITHTPTVEITSTPVVATNPTIAPTIAPTPFPTTKPTPNPTIDPEDPNADKDGDGFVNWKEWDVGSNYEDNTSTPDTIVKATPVPTSNPVEPPKEPTCVPINKNLPCGTGPMFDLNTHGADKYFEGDDFQMTQCKAWGDALNNDPNATHVSYFCGSVPQNMFGGGIWGSSGSLRYENDR